MMKVYSLAKGWHTMVSQFWFISKELRRLIVGGVAALVIAGAFFGYRYYTTMQEEGAAQAFLQCHQVYEKAHSDASQWQEVSSLCQLGMRRYAHTSLAPLFAAYYLDALIAGGDIKKSHEVAKELVASFKTNSPVKDLFRVKYALMRIDSDDIALQQDGLQELNTLATDEKSTAADSALYYGGVYYASIDNHEKAKESWQLLVDRNASQDAMNKSPWVSLAQEQLSR